MASESLKHIAGVMTHDHYAPLVNSSHTHIRLMDISIGLREQRGGVDAMYAMV